MRQEKQTVKELLESDNPFLKVIDVTKMFGEVAALNGIDFVFHRGSLGLVGPNGAGKTTLIKIIAGLIKQDSGHLEVFGQKPFNNLELLRGFGYSPEIDKQFDYLTGQEFVELGLRLRGYSREQAKKKALETISKVELLNAADRKIKGYSRGMRQRIKLAQAIAHDPLILLLDEPLQGTDPIARNLILEVFHDLRDNGVQIVISSHVLHDLQKTAEYVLLFNHGKILGEGKTSEIRQAIKEIPIRMEISSPNYREIAEILVTQEWIKSIDYTFNNRLVITAKVQDLFYLEFPRLVHENNWMISHLKPLDEDLEAVFNYVYRRSFHE